MRLNVLKAITFLAAVTVAGLVGCKNTNSIEACVQEGNLHCKWAFDCCTPAERFENLNVGGQYTAPTDNTVLNEMAAGHDGGYGRGDCEAAVATLCERAVLAVKQAEDDDRIEVNSENLDACLQPLKDAVDVCDTTAYMRYGDLKLKACDEILTGLVAEDGECYNDEDCAAPGSICKVDSTATTGQGQSIVKLAGVCVSSPANGEACDVALTGKECAPGLYCDANNTCVPEVAVGGSCAAGETCDSWTGYCNASSTCTALVSLAGACTVDGDCDPAQGLKCNASVCEHKNNQVYEYCTGK